MIFRLGGLTTDEKEQVWSLYFSCKALICFCIASGIGVWDQVKIKLSIESSVSLTSDFHELRLRRRISCSVSLRLCGSD